MSSKPETSFYQRVLKHKNLQVYHMKNHNPYAGGVADSWFSGTGGRG